jgi:hypothetical protein
MARAWAWWIAPHGPGLGLVDSSPNPHVHRSRSRSTVCFLEMWGALAHRSSQNEDRALVCNRPYLTAAEAEPRLEGSGDGTKP